MITVVTMTEDEFQLYQEFSIYEHAQKQVKSGHWEKATALQEAEREYQQLLPQGLQTPQQYLWMVVDEELGEKVGIIWFALREQDGEQRVLVYDVRIFAEFRRQGYAVPTSQVLAEKAAELGASVVSVHVFEHNRVSREMYEKLGYVVTDTSIVKKLTNHSASQKAE